MVFETWLWNLVAEQRVEDKRFFTAFGRGRAAFRPIGRIIDAGLAGALALGIGFGGARRIHGVRRQVEAGLAAAAAKRDCRRTQENDGPSRRGQAQITIHDEIPNAGAPYKDWFALARPG